MTFSEPRPRATPDDVGPSPIIEPSDAIPVGRWEWERAVKTERQASGMAATTQHIALLLATYSDAQDGSNIRPSVTTLIATSGRGKDTVHRALRWLRMHGWLRQVSQGSGGSRMASVYQLTLPSV